MLMLIFGSLKFKNIPESQLLRHCMYEYDRYHSHSKNNNSSLIHIILYIFLKIILLVQNIRRFEKFSSV